MFLDEKVFEIKTSSILKYVHCQKKIQKNTLFVVTYDKLERSLSKSESPLTETKARSVGFDVFLQTCT